MSLSNLKSDQRSLDTFILRPGDEGYIDPRDKVVRDQPILVNSGEEDQELVDDPDDQQTVGHFVQQGDEQEFVDDPEVQHLNPAIEINAEDGSSRLKNITKDEEVPTKIRTRSLTPEKAKNNNKSTRSRSSRPRYRETRSSKKNRTRKRYEESSDSGSRSSSRAVTRSRKKLRSESERDSRSSSFTSSSE